MDKAKIVALWALIFAIGTFITIIIVADVESSRMPAPVVSIGTK